MRLYLDGFMWLVVGWIVFWILGREGEGWFVITVSVLGSSQLCISYKISKKTFFWRYRHYDTKDVITHKVTHSIYFEHKFLQIIRQAFKLYQLIIRTNWILWVLLQFCDFYTNMKVLNYGILTHNKINFKVNGTSIMP